MKRQASSRRERTLRVRNRTAVQCMTRCGNKQPHKKGLSLKQDRGRPPGCATFACAYRVCSCADGQAASIHARLHRAVRTAQGGAGLHSGCHLRRCNRRQGAAPRSWRPRLQEQKVWSARGEAGAAARRGRRRAHGMASRLGPGRGRTPGWDVGPGRGRGVCILAPSLAGPAGKG